MKTGFCTFIFDFKDVKGYLPNFLFLYTFLIYVLFPYPFFTLVRGFSHDLLLSSFPPASQPHWNTGALWDFWWSTQEQGRKAKGNFSPHIPCTSQAEASRQYRFKTASNLNASANHISFKGIKYVFPGLQRPRSLSFLW